MTPDSRNSAANCITEGIHQEIVQNVQERLPDTPALQELAELFKLFSDTTRVRILWALSEAEMCVCDICALLQMKQPAVSHQLRNLKQARIVKNRREGKVIFYSIDDEHIRQLLNLAMEHIIEP